MRSRLHIPHAPPDSLTLRVHVRGRLGLPMRGDDAQAGKPAPQHLSVAQVKRQYGHILDHTYHLTLRAHATRLDHALASPYPTRTALWPHAAGACQGRLGLLCTYSVANPQSHTEPPQSKPPRTLTIGALPSTTVGGWL